MTAVVGAVVLLVMLATLLSGCAPGSPEAAAQAFYNAIEDGDWNAYIDSILPDRVRRMTSEERTYTKDSLKESGVTFKGLKFETKYTNKDKTEATVSIVAGEMSQENPATGEKEVITIDREKHIDKYFIKKLEVILKAIRKESLLNEGSKAVIDMLFN